MLNTYLCLLVFGVKWTWKEATLNPISCLHRDILCIIWRNEFTPTSDTYQMTWFIFGVTVSPGGWGGGGGRCDQWIPWNPLYQKKSNLRKENNDNDDLHLPKKILLFWRSKIVTVAIFSYGWSNRKHTVVDSHPGTIMWTLSHGCHGNMRPIPREQLCCAFSKSERFTYELCHRRCSPPPPASHLHGAIVHLYPFPSFPPPRSLFCLISCLLVYFK